MKGKVIIMKINVRLAVLFELVLLVAVIMGFELSLDPNFEYSISSFIDFLSFLGIIIIVIPSLIFMGEWKNFLKAFSVGKKKYTLLELKNINGAVSACQKLVLYAGLMEFIMQLIIILHSLDVPEALGPYISVAILTVFYAAFFECLLVPVKTNAERVMNEEIDIDVEEE